MAPCAPFPQLCDGPLHAQLKLSRGFGSYPAAGPGGGEKKRGGGGVTVTGASSASSAPASGARPAVAAGISAKVAFCCALCRPGVL